MFDTGRSSEGIACPAGYAQVAAQANSYVVRNTEAHGYDVRVQNVLTDLFRRRKDRSVYSLRKHLVFWREQYWTAMAKITLMHFSLM